MNRQFNNDNLQELYNVANSNEFAACQRPIDMYHHIIVYIKAVLYDKDALEEAKNWSQFRSISSQLNGERMFGSILDLDISLCFGLWMFIYH